MKKYFFLSMMLAFYVSCSTYDTAETEPQNQALVFDGDVLLENQLEVNEFGAQGYTEITGNLEIVSEFETTDPIISLDSLATLKIIGGDLRLINLNDLSSLEGFNNLEQVSGYMYLYASDLVSSLSPLSNISSTVTGLEIFVYRGLTSLEGLENISIASGGDLIIEGNDSLVDLSAIANGLPSTLRFLKFDELVFSCGPSCTSTIDPIPQPFTSFDFLSNVTEVEWLRIKGFVGTNIEGLENLTSVDQFTIWRNPNLINLNGLSAVTSNVEGAFIVENESLTTLEGLENTASFHTRFFVGQNPVLGDLCAVQNNLSANFEDGNFGIMGNAYNPSILEILNGDCSL